MSAVSPLLIICFDVEELASLTTLASGLGYPDAHVVVGHMSEAIAELNSRTVPPDYLIIDVADRGREIFADLDELALHCDPRVRVVVIGQVNDINFYRELRQRGVAEYCARPAQLADVRAVLLQNQSATSMVSAAQQGTVISCMSAASGDGSSTLAVNLAYCLAEEFNQPTILIDMDYQFGLIAKSLDLTAPFGIRELFDYPERGVDELLVEKMQVKYGKNLRIVASPHELRQLPVIRPEPIRDLISILRTKFRFVVLDIPHVWTQWTAAALTYSDHVTMVAQLWLRSLTHASRMMAAWQTIGLSQNAMSLVINRSGAKFKEAITAHDFERVCHKKIDAYLNNDIKAIVNAETQGKTLFEANQDVLLKQQIQQFAQMMMGHSNGTPVSVAPADTRKNLLTFLGKKNG